MVNTSANAPFNAQALAGAKNPEDESTGELIRDALQQTRDLVRLEVALAREEAMSELASIKHAAVAAGVAAALALSGLIMFFVSLALCFNDPRLGAVVIGAIVMCLALALGFAAWRAFPKRPLAGTKERIQADVKELKERVA